MNIFIYLFLYLLSHIYIAKTKCCMGFKRKQNNYIFLFDRQNSVFIY